MSIANAKKEAFPKANFGKASSFWDKKRFIPEDRGRIVTVFLENYFKKYVEYDFTAQMEEFLDDVSSGNMEWKKLLEGFWVKFERNVEGVTFFEIITKLVAPFNIICYNTLYSMA